MNFLSFVQNRMTARSANLPTRQRRPGIPAAVDVLESRALLSANLFIDFGDNFAGGTLTTTEGAFRDVANDAVPNNRILGTELAGANGTFSANTRLDIVAQTFTAAERAQIVAVVQRDYLPLDIHVVALTATSQTTADGRVVSAAHNMTDVINTLRGGNTAWHDAYVFVGTFIADPLGANRNVFGNNGGGKSPDDGLDKADLTTGLNNHDDVAAVYSAGGFTLNTTNNIAHEAGHCFGLQHALTFSSSVQTPIDSLHEGELMSYFNTNVTTASMFMRYPTVRGDDNSPKFTGALTLNAAARTLVRATGSFIGNGFKAGSQLVISGTTGSNGTFTIATVTATTITLAAGSTITNETPANAVLRTVNPNNVNDLEARNGATTSFDQIAANVGANPNYTFVSGTGTNDIITIAKAGAVANVTVQAFADPGFTTPIIVPGLAVTTFSYVIPLTHTILVYTGDRTNRVVVDGDLGVDVQIDGMHTNRAGGETLVVRGKGAASATYTPGSIVTAANVDVDGVTSLTGAVNINGHSIAFTDFSTSSSLVQLQDITSVTYVSPAGQDNLSLFNDAPGRTEIFGTVNNSTLAAPLDFTNVRDFTVNTTQGNLNTTNDFVTVNQPIAAAGLKNFSVVMTGAGNNTLQLFANSYALPVAGGAFTFFGGPGTNTVFAQADVSFTLTDLSLGIVGGGNVTLVGIQNAVLSGGASNNTFTVSNWTGTATLDGQDGSDTYNITFKGTGAGVVTIHDTGAVGTDLAIVNGTANPDRFRIDTAVRLGTELVNFDATLERLRVNGLDGADRFDVVPSVATAIEIDGGNPGFGSLSSILTGPGDAIFLDITGVTQRSLTLNRLLFPTAGFWTFGGQRQAVSFANVENLDGFDIRIIGVVNFYQRVLRIFGIRIDTTIPFLPF